MAGFIEISLLCVLVIFITSLITYEILRYVWNALPNLTIAPRLRVLAIVVPIFVAHIINIWIYGVVYFLLENYAHFGKLAGDILPAGWNYESFVERIYFSALTYTSLGFSGILATSDLRMLMSAEVLNGIVTLGWTVSFTYLTMEQFWTLPHRHKRKKESSHE